MDEEFNILDGHYIEVLCELGNIGTGNAVTAFSKILNKKITMKTPKAQILDFNDVGSCVGGSENILVGILVGVADDINGIIMFIIERKPAQALVSMILNRPRVDGNEFDDMALSMLTEVGNILINSYLSSLSTMTKLKATPTVPMLAIDMAGAILSVPAIEFGKVADRVFFLETIFETEGEDVSGYFLLVPDVPSYKLIFNSLGVL